MSGSISLSELFKKNNNQKFVFVKPGGNWGDDLIYFGAECLAKYNKLNYETCSLDEFIERPVDDSIVYIHGGGGYNEWCSGRVFDCLQHAITNYSSMVIQGPCTSSTNLEFLTKRFDDCFKNKISEKIYFFAREHTSHNLYKNIQSIIVNCDVGIDQDTAFHSDTKLLIKKAGGLEDNYTLFGIRVDNEAPTLKFEQDITKVIADPAVYAKSFDHWIRLHAFASSIVTNRTHSGILGALLKKDTTLFGSKYHKNKSIFDYSLVESSANWPNEKELSSVLRKSLISNFIPNKIQQSYRITKALDILRGLPDQ